MRKRFALGFLPEDEINVDQNRQRRYVRNAGSFKLEIQFGLRLSADREEGKYEADRQQQKNEDEQMAIDGQIAERQYGVNGDHKPKIERKQLHHIERALLGGRTCNVCTKINKLLDANRVNTLGSARSRKGCSLPGTRKPYGKR